MDREEKQRAARRELKHGQKHLKEAAGFMEDLGDKKGADKVRKHADDAVKILPSQDPKLV